jgi:hypothetical protein
MTPHAPTFEEEGVILGSSGLEEEGVVLGEFPLKEDSAPLVRASTGMDLFA